MLSTHILRLGLGYLEKCLHNIDIVAHLWAKHLPILVPNILDRVDASLSGTAGGRNPFCSASFRPGHFAMVEVVDNVARLIG